MLGWINSGIHTDRRADIKIDRYVTKKHTDVLALFSLMNPEEYRIHCTKITAGLISTILISNKRSLDWIERATTMKEKIILIEVQKHMHTRDHLNRRLEKDSTKQKKHRWHMIHCWIKAVLTTIFTGRLASHYGWSFMPMDLIWFKQLKKRFE